MPATQSTEARALAADFLFDAAMTYLNRYSQPNTVYTIGLAHCEQVLHPGEKVRVIYSEWRDGVKVIGIDFDLIILESTISCDSTGARTTRIQASTVDSWPPTDGGLIAGLVAKLNHISAGFGAVGVTGGQAGSATLLEVRDRQDVPIFRADHDTESAQIGPSTTPNIEYDGERVLIAGSPIAPVLRASAEWYPGIINGLESASIDIIVTGADKGDGALASHDNVSNANWIVSAFVLDTNVVRVVVFNSESGGQKIDNGYVHITVLKNP